MTARNTRDLTPTNTVAEFKYAWNRVIAAAWKDPKLEQRLLSATAKDVHQIVLEVTGIDCQNTLGSDFTNIRVKKYNGDGWSPTQQSWTLTAPEITLPYPPKPDDSDAAVALADYDFQGAASPFTCCC